MAMIVSTNGKPTHMYVGYKVVPVDENGQTDPIEMELALLRRDGRQIVDDTMNEFRRSLGLHSFRRKAWWL